MFDMFENFNSLQSLTLKGPLLNALSPFHTPLVLSELPELPNLKFLTFFGERFEVLEARGLGSAAVDETRRSGRTSLYLPSLQVIEFHRTDYVLICDILTRLEAPDLNTITFRRIDPLSSRNQAYSQRFPTLHTSASGKPVKAVQIMNMQLDGVQNLVADIPNQENHNFKVEFSPSTHMYASLFRRTPASLDELQGRDEWEQLCHWWNWLMENTTNLEWVVFGRDLRKGVGGTSPSFFEAMKLLEQAAHSVSEL